MIALPEPTRGAIDGAVHRYALRVYYEDTDAGGVVYHANYLRWFERARSDLVEGLGIDQRDALETGAGLYTVAEAHLRYHSSARLGDTIMVETRATVVGRVSCTLEQVALRDGERLCSATVKVGFIGPDGRPRKQPAAWQQAFATFSQAGAAMDAVPGAASDSSVTNPAIDAPEGHE